MMYPSKNEVYFQIVILFILGISLCVFNITLLTTILRVLGIICTIAALFFLYNAFIQKNSSQILTAILCVPLLFIGIKMTTDPRSILKILPMLAGIVCILHAISQLSSTFTLKKNGFTGWKVDMILSIITLCIGILLFFQPIQSLSFVFQLIGGFFIFDACVLLFNQFMMDKYD